MAPFNTRQIPDTTAQPTPRWNQETPNKVVRELNQQVKVSDCVRELR